MFGAYNFVGGGTLRIQALIEPKKDRTDLGVQIPRRPLDELHCERSVQRRGFRIGGGRRPDRSTRGHRAQQAVS